MRFTRALLWTIVVLGAIGIVVEIGKWLAVALAVGGSLAVVMCAIAYGVMWFDDRHNKRIGIRCEVCKGSGLSHLPSSRAGFADLCLVCNGSGLFYSPSAKESHR